MKRPCQENPKWSWLGRFILIWCKGNLYFLGLVRCARFRYLLRLNQFKNKVMEIAVKQYIPFSETERSILKSPSCYWSKYSPTKEEFIAERDRLSDLGEIDREENGYTIFYAVEAISKFEIMGCYSMDVKILVEKGGLEYSKREDAMVASPDLYRTKTAHFYKDGTEMTQTDYHFLSSKMVDEEGNEYSYSGRGNIYNRV